MVVRFFAFRHLNMYQSETSKHRELLQSYCSGYGCDIGFGGDPINEVAIRVDLPQPYASTGHLTPQLGGDCRDLKWFRDGVLDYVYSSHVLEDFQESETELILREWMRVLRPGGRIVLLLPDQQRYLKHCAETGQPTNPYHAISHFSLDYIRETASRIPGLKVRAGEDIDNDYSFYIVLERVSPVAQGTSEDELLRQRLETTLEQNRNLGQENVSLKEQLDRIRKNPLVAPLLKIRAALRAAIGT
jgi:predicted SAM-dependent methyltransferase